MIVWGYGCYEKHRHTENVRCDDWARKNGYVLGRKYFTKKTYVQVIELAS